MSDDTQTKILPIHEWFSPEPQRHRRTPPGVFAGIDLGRATNGTDWFEYWVTTAAPPRETIQQQFRAYRDAFTRTDLDRAARQMRQAPVFVHRPDAAYIVHPDAAIDADLIAQAREHRELMLREEERQRLRAIGRQYREYMDRQLRAPLRETITTVQVGRTPVTATLRLAE